MEDNYNNNDYENLVYFGYYTRIILYSLSIILVLLVSCLFFKYSLGYGENNKVKFLENGSMDYKVNFKENTFYLNPPNLYNNPIVSSEIDSLTIDYDYFIDFVKEFKGEVNYNLMGNLVLYNDAGNKVLDNKYILAENQAFIKEDATTYKIDKTYEFDYKYYKGVIDNIVKEYSNNVYPHFTVYLNVFGESENNILNIVNDSTSMYVNFDFLDTETIINSHSINARKRLIVKEGTLKVTNYIFFVVGIILIFLDLYLISKIGSLFVSITPKISKYDEFLDEVLTNYDSYIVECKTLPEFKEKHIIKVVSFDELLDTFKIVNLPIMYVNVTNHIKSHFYIMQGDNVFLYTLKAVDLEEGNK